MSRCIVCNTKCTLLPLDAPAAGQKNGMVKQYRIQKARYFLYRVFLLNLELLAYFYRWIKRGNGKWENKID